MRNRTEYDEARSLLAAGASDMEVSRLTGIPRPTISGWRRGESRTAHRGIHSGSEGCGVAHDFHLLSRGDYAYLLGLYLGDGCISPGARGVFHLRIACDAIYPKIIEDGLAALQAVFPSNHASAQPQKTRCVNLSLYSKHLPCFFPQHGPGRKHDRPIYLAPWQEEVIAAHRRQLVRGLIHSDGNRCVATEWSKSGSRKSTRYSFSNKSEDIKKIFCDSLDLLGVRWTRPSDREIAIYRKASVAILDEFIGPRHRQEIGRLTRRQPRTVAYGF